MDGRVKIKYNFMSIVKQDNCRTTHNLVCLTISQTTPARTLSLMKICFEMAHSSKTALIKAIELQGMHSFFFHHTFRYEPTSYNVKDPLHLQTHWSSTGFSTHTRYVLPLHLSWLHLSFSLSWLSIKSHPTLWQSRFSQITSCLASIST